MSLLAGCSINDSWKNVEKPITSVEAPVKKQVTVPQKSDKTITVDEEHDKKFSYLEQLPATQNRPSTTMILHNLGLPNAQSTPRKDGATPRTSRP